MGTRTSVDAVTSLTVPITGMTCASCEKRVTKAIRRVPGVRSVQVSAARGTATVGGDATLDRGRLDEAIRSAGYEPVAAPWLSRDPSVWRTAVVAAVAVGVLVVPGVRPRAHRPHLRLVRPGPRRPALRARPRAHGRGVHLHGHGRRAGARLLRVARRRPRGPWRDRAAVPDPDAPPGRLQRRAHRRLRRPRRPARRPRVDDEPAHAGDRGAGAGRRRRDVPARRPAHRRLAAGGRVVPPPAGRPVPGARHRRRHAAAGYSHSRTALVGAATFFLPCGFTQAVQVYALSTASPVAAGAIMATFAVGPPPGCSRSARCPSSAPAGARSPCCASSGCSCSGSPCSTSPAP